MKFQYANNPTWADAANSVVNLTVKFDTVPGEVLFSASPLDTEEHGRVLYSKAVAGEFGQIPPYSPPAPATEQIIAEFTEAIQQRLDTFARTRNYDGILSLASYVNDPNPKFAAEGQYGITARSQTWAVAKKILVDVQAGTRPMPTMEQVLADLPVLEWPQ